MDYGLNGMRLPNQDDELVRRLCYRWLRALDTHNKWAKKAKQCVQFLEGEQWTEEEKAILKSMGRTALTLNKIAPLYRLVVGYQSSNRLDASFMPTSNAQSSEDVAEVLNNLDKSELNRIKMKFTDTDVFCDGLSTGRGFWDTELCFDDNELGELSCYAADPFSKYIDPDCKSYDLNCDKYGAAYIQDSVWTNLDAINDLYGSDAALAVQNIFSPGYNSSVLSYMSDFELSPERFFGGYEDEKDYADWTDVYYNDFIDHQAKNVRLLDTEYKMKSIMPCFVDLETGDKEPIPQEWIDDPSKIEKVMHYAEKIGNPLAIMKRPVNRVRF